MKRLLATGIILILSSTAWTEGRNNDSSQVLFTRISSHGGYGTISLQVSSINDRTGILVGGYGGWLINHVLMIGLGGYGLANDVIDDHEIPYYAKRMQFGYGGLMLEWIYQPRKLINPAISCLIGGGTASTNDLSRIQLDWGEDYWDNRSFFVLEPCVTLQLNITSYIRSSLGASYRYVSSFDYDSIDQSDVKGFNLRMNLLVGKF